jgi:hypothetical protein
MSMLHGKDAFSKTKSFKEHKHYDLAVKHMLFKLEPAMNLFITDSHLLSLLLMLHKPLSLI